MHREVLKQYLPTIERSVGGHGADAVTSTLKNIELKSSTWDRKSDPTIDTWKPTMFDMSKLKDLTKIYDYQALGLDFGQEQEHIIANFFIGSTIKKLHPCPKS